MALVRRLTNGTRAQHLVAACIYLTCRMEGTARNRAFGALKTTFVSNYCVSDLLIDIADVIDIDVYTLGHTFMRIAKAFNLNIPTVGKNVELMFRMCIYDYFFL